ncbi:MAG: ATP-grasp domain-containing protein [Gaiellaceae bacterium]
MATLLFLGASISQLPAIRHARAAGHRVVAVDGDPDAVGFQVADVCVNVDFSNIAVVAAAGAEHHVDGVLAISSDRAVVPAAMVADQLGLPTIGAAVARAMTDKWAMRTELERAGVPQPRYALVTAGTDVSALVERLPTPAVLKPADSGGQRGLFMVEDAEAAEAHLAETLAFSRLSHALLEEYVDGTELNGILVVRGGEPALITFSDRLRPAGPGFGVGWIHSYPSRVGAQRLERAREIAYAAVRALGLRDGIAFPQLIVRDDDVRLIEIAARIGAGQMADLVRHATGVELFDVAILQALGRDVPDALIAPKIVRPIAIRFLTADPGVLPVGDVTSIHGLDDVRASPGVLDANLYFDVGATIGPLRVDADRRGYVIATSDTPEQALALADGAARKLKVEVRERARARRQALVFVPAAAALAAAAALLAVLVFRSTPGPRLVSDTVRERGGVLHVRYRFDEPVRTILLVDGKPAAETGLRQGGELVWHARGGRHRFGIEGVDSSGRHSAISPI